jgi:hypothetical protein
MNRSRTISRFLIPLFILALVGCASSPPPEPPPVVTAPASSPATMASPSSTMMGGDPTMATVYIYRPRSIMGMALQPTVMLDGQDLLDARNGTVWKGTFKPGRYSFQMDDKKTGADLDLRPGEAYYMRVDIVPGVFKGGGRMTQVTAEQGAKDTAKLNPLPPGEVKHAMFKGM